MPVLGESPSRRTATAYPQFSGNYMQQLAQMATLVAIVFLLRNVFFYVSIQKGALDYLHRLVLWFLTRFLLAGLSSR